MDNIRWILILAGVAILVLLYMSGRPKRGAVRSESPGLRRRSAAAHEHLDPLLGDDDYVDQSAVFDDINLDDMARPDASAGHQPMGTDLGRDSVLSPGFTSFAQKIEAISEKLSPKRRQRVADFEPADLEEVTPSDPEFANKIISMHVVAPVNQYFDGQRLLEVLEDRGYHFGEMNIFHSMHNGQTVFSVAKMVEPGYFDIDDVESFATPGISMILQLPGPVSADVAFEVLVSEAFDIAGELEGSVLDGDRNTLSKQTLQHMREGIYEYMHRQKYFGSVPS